jgi:hypothetical protein
MGGPCSGGHIDIKPYDIVKVIARSGGCRCRRWTGCDVRA